ncbi:MAG: hypothetical protein PHW62_00540 [Candidatus Ratteibacteria bacterium]|nr:hypothetical protein [Candidatus Ratteibacteria bacterium]
MDSVKTITARRKGGTCIIASKTHFKAGEKYIVSSPAHTVLKIQKLPGHKVVNSTFLKPKISIARNDRRTVTLSVGKYLNPGEKIELLRFTTNEFVFKIIDRERKNDILETKEDY